MSDGDDAGDDAGADAGADAAGEDAVGLLAAGLLAELRAAALDAGALDDEAGDDEAGDEPLLQPASDAASRIVTAPVVLMIMALRNVHSISPRRSAIARYEHYAWELLPVACSQTKT